MTQQKLTITEALAEIKTLEKRIEKKASSIGPYLARQEGVRDPLEKSGGSVAFVAAERQSIRDLQNNIVKLRIGINRANDEANITVEGETRTISEWLIWRRDISKKYQGFLQSLMNSVTQVRQEARRKGSSLVTQQVGTDIKPEDWVINFDEKEVMSEAERLETVLNSLDGQLSLKNATTLISY